MDDWMVMQMVEYWANQQADCWDLVTASNRVVLWGNSMEIHEAAMMVVAKVLSTADSKEVLSVAAKAIEKVAQMANSWEWITVDC